MVSVTPLKWDPQDQMRFVDYPGRVAQQSEVRVVGSGLVYELLSLLAGNGWEWTVTYRGRPVAISLEHGVYVELGHGEDHNARAERENERRL